jgi:hypothetical protein
LFLYVPQKKKRVKMELKEAEDAPSTTFSDDPPKEVGVFDAKGEGDLSRAVLTYKLHQ